MKITWDNNKSRTNKAKHGINFTDTEAIFYDPNLITKEDIDSEGEHRFISVGCDSLGRILTVVYAYQNEDTVIRMISARHATKNEEEHYYET